MNIPSARKAAAEIISEHFCNGLYTQHLPEWVRHIRVRKEPFKDGGQSQIFLITGSKKWPFSGDRVMVLKIFEEINDPRWLEREAAIREKLGDDEDLLSRLVLPVDCFQVIDERGHSLRCHVYLYKTPFSETTGSSDEDCVNAVVRLSDLLPSLHKLAAQRIFNRDIKASNLYADPQSGRIMIGDWSVSNNTRSNATPIGTFPEIAPEVAASDSGCENDISKCDMYSLAMTMLYHLNGMAYPDYDSILVPHSKGLVPFPEPLLGSKQLGQAVLKGVEHNPERRYKNCMEFFEEICQTPEYKLYIGTFNTAEDNVESSDFETFVEEESVDFCECCSAAVEEKNSIEAEGDDDPVPEGSAEDKDFDICEYCPVAAEEEKSAGEEIEESVVPEGFAEDEAFDICDCYPVVAEALPIDDESEEKTIPESFIEDESFDFREYYHWPACEESSAEEQSSNTAPTKKHNIRVRSRVYTGPGLYPEDMTEDFSDGDDTEGCLHPVNPEEVVCDGSADFAALRKQLRVSAGTVLLFSDETVPSVAFYGTPLKKAVLCGTKVIERKAFRNSGITKLNLCEGLHTIEFGAFSGTKLVEVTMPSTLRVIGAGAFACCDELKTVRLPSSLERLERRAFSYCRSLKNIYLPKGIKSIAHDAFAGTDIHIYSEETPLKHWPHRMPDNITWHKLVEKRTKGDLV